MDEQEGHNARDNLNYRLEPTANGLCSHSCVVVAMIAGEQEVVMQRAV